MSSLDKIFPCEYHPKGQDLMTTADFAGKVVQLMGKPHRDTPADRSTERISWEREEWTFWNEFQLDDATFSYLYRADHHTANPRDAERVLKNGEHFQDELGHLPNFAHLLKLDQGHFRDSHSYATYRAKSKAAVVLTFNWPDRTHSQSQVDSNGKYDRTPSGEIIELYRVDDGYLMGRIGWEWYPLDEDRSIRGLVPRLLFLCRGWKRK